MCFCWMVTKILTYWLVIYTFGWDYYRGLLYSKYTVFTVPALPLPPPLCCSESILAEMQIKLWLGPPVWSIFYQSTIKMLPECLMDRWFVTDPNLTLTFLVFPLQIQWGPVVVGGASLGGEVPAALCVGSHHVGVRRQSWKQRVSYYRVELLYLFNADETPAWIYF